MKDFLHININDYNYDLPNNKIAKYPLHDRDASKLLVLKDSIISEFKFKNISELLPPNSLLVFNNTKVLNARMHFKKDTGANIEIFCLEPVTPIDYAMSLSSTKNCSWKCLVGNNKKWKTGSLTKHISILETEISLSITKLAQIGNSFEILFEWDKENIHFSDILETAGNIPIPPYLNRDSEEIDNNRYQTIYSELDGSVAAPTAGLHFTDEVMHNISAKNIITDYVTLHVGAGTFHPVKSDEIANHEMHTEHFIITKKNIENLIQYCGNITVVGTTSVRTLESTYQVALQILRNPELNDNRFHISQWEAYESRKDKIGNNTSIKLLQNMLNWMSKNDFSHLFCTTQIMILPSYEFKLTNRLITNFHQPKSTLLLLLAAFIGERWKEVYEFAMKNNFRFLSYGDSSLFFQK